MAEAIEIGTIFDGRFRIEGKLGSGGFATVYAATALDSSQQVALKVVHRDVGEQPQARRRFAREASILARLKSPHTITLLAHGTSSDGRLYIVFELLSGEDLSALLNRAGTLDPDRAVELLRQLLESLDEAHRAGVLHRDIKPENIRLVPGPEGPRAVLMDFGIARPSDDGSPAITATGELVGTPRYMSPEQLTGRMLGPASDIYSLGIVLLELLIGRSELHGGRWGDQIERLHSGYVFPIAGLEAHVDLLAIIARMTARDPSHRFQSARSVLHALDAEAGERPTGGAPTKRHARAWAAVALVIAASFVLIVVAVSVFGDDDAAPRPRVDGTTARPSLVAAPSQQAPPAKVDAGDNDVREFDVGLPRAVDSLGDGCFAPAQIGLSRLRIEKHGLVTYVPKAYASDRRHPVVMLLHDEGIAPSALLSNGGFIEAAERHGFVVVAPWGGDIRPIPANAWARDEGEIERLERILRVAETYLCLDAKRVFVIGQGAGGSLAYRLACPSVPWVAAAAAHDYSMSEANFKCDGDDFPPHPFLLAMGTRDKVKPVHGGLECPTTNRKLSHEEQFELWRKRARCDAKPTVSELNGADCRQYENCEVPFEACQTDGGADWPGVTKFRIPECDRGPMTTFALAHHVFEFFAHRSHRPTK